MNEDFQARLARIEAKSRSADAPTHAAPPPPPSGPTGPSGPSGPSGGGGGPRMFKFILGGVAALVGLPVAAVFATVLYANNQGSLENILNGFDLLKTSYIDGSTNPDVTSARRQMDGVMLRLTTGTMSQEEGAHLASMGGQQALADTQGNTMNFDAFEEKAKKIYVSE